MILNIFLNLLDNFKENLTSDVYSAVPLDYIFIFVIAIFILTVFLVFITLILPLFRKSSSKLYKRYLYLRDEMKKIDQVYSSKKITFDEYVSMQFLNAQEYYKIVKILSKDKEFKSKLKSYTLKDNFDRSSTSLPKRPLSKEEIREKQINKICQVLRPNASRYTKEDIYGVLVYEGFERDFILEILKKLISQGIVFSKKIAEHKDKDELAISLNKFFEEGGSEYKGDTSESISFKKENKDKSFFKDESTRKPLDFKNVNDVDFTFDKVSKKEDLVKEKKPGFFKRLFSFKSKEKPSINEIDNILKNIEEEIKS